MTSIRIARTVFSAFILAWIAATPAWAQMPLLIEEILMSDHGKRSTSSVGPAVAVDRSGQWLALRSVSAGQRDTGMPELLEFDVADVLADHGSASALGDDYERFPWATTAGTRLWGYDDAPLDHSVRGRAPNEVAPHPAEERHATPGAGARGSLTPAASVSGAISKLIATVLRAPRYVMNAIKAVYASDHSLLLGGTLFVLCAGLGAFADLARGVGRI